MRSPAKLSILVAAALLANPGVGVAAPPRVDTFACTTTGMEQVVGEALVLLGKGDREAAIARLRKASEDLQSCTESGRVAEVELAASRRRLAELWHALGEWDQADAEHERNIAMIAAVHGETSDRTLDAIEGAARAYWAVERPDRAHALFGRARDAVSQRSGATSVDAAVFACLMGTSSMMMGRLDRAELELGAAIEVLDREAAGAPITIDAHTRLAQIDDAMFRAEAGVKRAERALALAEARWGKQAPELDPILLLLANLYMKVGRQLDAEQALLRDVAILEAAKGTHPETAVAYNNLAIFYASLGESWNADARRALERAMEIKRGLARHGPHARWVARTLPTNLINLAALQVVGSELEAGLATGREALAMAERELGPNADETASVRRVLALQLYRAGDSRGAYELLAAAQPRIEDRLAMVLRSGDAETKQRALEGTMAGFLSLLLSLQLDSLPTNRDALRLAYDQVLLVKGRGVELTADLLGQVQRTGDLDQRRRLQQWHAEVRSLSGLELAGADAEQLETRRARVDALEQALLRDSVGLRRQLEVVRTADVAASLPTGAVLVEFVRFNLERPERGSYEDAPAHYAAYLVHGDGRLSAFNLGPAAAIDANITKLRTAIVSEADVGPVARELHAQLFAPLARAIEAADLVLLAPDSQLHLLPFDALIGPDGKYLIESLRLHVIDTGRELVQLRDPIAVSKQPALVLADPDYGSGRGRSDGYFAGVVWPALPGTRTEGEAVAELLGVEPALRGDASEARLLAAESASVLHIATHGFFAAAPTDAVGKVRGLVITDESPTQAQVLDNPMLRSGLVLSGANVADGGDDDGWLTALEVSSLDLSGTQLVVMSACETGVGEARSGDSVYGLRRALTLAGAQSQVMSLWKVDDHATAALMVDFYRRLASGQPRLDALRDAQLALLKAPETQHPRYWAPFIAVGRWDPVELPSAIKDGGPPKIGEPARGCACTASGSTPGWAWLSLLATALWLPRRRSKSADQ